MGLAFGYFNGFWWFFCFKNSSFIFNERVESYFYDKRVAFYFFGYDVARLLVGSKEQLAIVTQISFKVMPNTYVGKLSAAVKLENKSVLRTEIEDKLKQVFDPKGVFQ